MDQEKNRTILLVEDEAITAASQKSFLESRGFSVIHVSSGEKAIELMEKGKEQVDLILMDIDLGKGMDGIETASVILRERDIPLVFLSSRMEPDILARAEEVSPYGYVDKNTVGPALLASIRMAFRLFKANIQLAQANSDLLGTNEELNAALEEADSATESLQRAEHELRFSLDRLQLALDAVEMGVWAWTIRSDSIDWDERMYALHGLRKGEYDGTFQSWLAMVHEEDRPEFARTMMDAESFDVEFRIEWPDGTIHLVKTAGRMERDEWGNVTGKTGVCMDMTGHWLRETALGERIKELDCLFSMSGIVESEDASLDNIFSRVAAIIPPAWWHPAKISARITVDGKEYMSPRFALSSACQVADIVVRGKKTGTLEVFHEGGESVAGRGPFLKEESRLLHAIAERLGRIIERRGAEEALVRQERYLRSILDTTRDGFWVINNQRRFVEVNEAYCRMSGYGRDELLELSIADIDMNESDDDTGARIAGIISRGWDIFETRHRRKDGSHFDVEVSVSFLKDDGGQFICFCRDISDRKTAEEKLRESEENYRTLVETINTGIFKSTMDGRFLMANMPIVRMAGYESLEEFLKVPASSLYADIGDRERIIGEMSRIGHVSGVEMRSAKKDGTRYWISMNAMIQKDRDGKPLYIQGSIQDVTERRKAAEMLVKSAEEKEVLLRELQHRVKNNLNIVSGLLNLEMANLEDEKSKEIFEDMRRRISTISTLYEKLYHSTAVGTVNLAEYLGSLASVIVKVNTADESDIRLITNMDEVTVKVRQAVPLGLVMNEMLTNAVKYAYPGGRGGELRVDLGRSGDCAFLRVSDDGSGIPEEVRNGLGTRLVSMLAEQIGGTFELRSEKGTTGIVTFHADGEADHE